MADVIVSLVHDGLGIGVDDAGEQSWQDRALCAQTDPEAFFPEKGGSTREAKRVCRSCEVRAECLEYALEPRREVRHLGRSVGARAAQAAAPGGLARGADWPSVWPRGQIRVLFTGTPTGG